MKNVQGCNEENISTDSFGPDTDTDDRDSNAEWPFLAAAIAKGLTEDQETQMIEIYNFINFLNRSNAYIQKVICKYYKQ